MILPQRFDPAIHRVAFFCPSDSVRHFPRRLNRAVESVKRVWGCEVVLAGVESEAGEDFDFAKKADQLHRLLAAPDIGLIIAATGGYTSVCLLPHLDEQLIRSSRKAIVGSSDVTALLLGLFAMTGVVTFHGPTALAGFGELGPTSDYALNSLFQLVAGERLCVELADPLYGHDLFRFWDREDDEPPALSPWPAREMLFKGRIEGTLIGGNLDTLVAITGTPYAPAWASKILFWEAAFGSLSKLHRDLEVLDAAGVFNQIAGMVVGRPFRVAGAEDRDIYALAKQIAERNSIPTIAGLALGHTAPILSVPIGVPASLDATDLSLVVGGSKWK